MILASTIARAPLARAADVAITDDARARFTAGVNLLKDPEGPRYEEAYREFKAAYAASPSYKILGNLGLCAMKLERDDEAIAAFDKYIAEAPDLSPAEVAQVKADLQTLKVGVAHVVLTSNPPGAQVVDTRLPVRGERISNSYGPLTGPTKVGIRQGQHAITAKLAGYPDVTWEIDANSANLGEHSFEFKKAAVAEGNGAAVPANGTTRPMPATVYGFGIATGVFAIGTGVLGALAASKHSDYQKANTGSDPASATSLKDSGQTMNLATDVCLGAAVVSAGLTAYFFFSRPTGEAAAAAAPNARPVTASEKLRKAAASIVWTPEYRPGGGGITVLGRF